MNLPPDDIVVKIHAINQHKHLRQIEFPSLADQLDKLWHDIDSGLFGESAKTGSFYTDIKTVKDANPKNSNIETLQSVLDALIESLPE